jgi:two-component system cell cycle response regulator DivK
MAASILIIEDNEDNLRLVEYVLRVHGYEPLVATTGAEGVRIALERRPNLILLDIRMPRMDGYEVAARVKDAGLKDTRIIATTAPAIASEQARLDAAGFDGCIHKPIDPTTLVADVERLLGRAA